MPRLRSRATGVVIDVSDETAASLDAAWESADKPVAKVVPAKNVPDRRKSE